MLFRIFTILAVVALAVSTWILSTPGLPSRLRPESAKAARPGYYLLDAVLTDYDQNGAPSVKIAAARIDQIGGGEEVALHDIHVNYQAPGGESWVMAGDLAHIEPGGDVVDVQGHVQLRGTDANRRGAAIISSDQMTYDVATAVASTPGDVRFDFLDQTLTARGLVADLKSRTVRLESRISGHFAP
ncbi:MAG: LPS export ABC transporter periplasmic protein LptC [Gammaproteobacteria bacterium]|nr:LPS export ABC transporter periplasmic protein LptC [Gammaproteobacteria bacterium]MDE2347069.1 LPS export ABC transporter periplasmic protein LptC [Gammaproteobacteria bacterium]